MTTAEERVELELKEAVKKRVELELKELEERLNKLKTFVLGKAFSELSTTQQMLLMSQIDIMTSYANCLHRRLKFWED